MDKKELFTKLHKHGKILMVTTAVLFTFLLLISSEKKDSTLFEITFFGCIFLFIVGFLMSIPYKRGKQTECPNCHEWYKNKFSDRKVLRNWQERKKDDKKGYVWLNCEEGINFYICENCGHP